MNIFQEKQNLTSQVTCDNPHVKIQKCKDKKKAHTNAIYTYTYIYIYIYIYIATLTTLVVVWTLWFFKIFFWSELYWWALKEQNSCCLQIDCIYICMYIYILYIYIYIYIYKYIYIYIQIYIYIYLYIYIARKEVTLVFSLVELLIWYFQYL